jgi:hypothetical protein
MLGAVVFPCGTLFATYLQRWWYRDAEVRERHITLRTLTRQVH